MTDRNELVEALKGTIDALDECAGRLLDKTPELVEPQLDAMSDQEADDHALFHQVIKPAQERALRALRESAPRTLGAAYGSHS